MVKKGFLAGDFFQEGENWYLVEKVLENGNYISRRVSNEEKKEIEAEAAKEKKAAEAEAKKAADKAAKEKKAAEKAAQKASRNAENEMVVPDPGKDGNEDTEKTVGREDADGKSAEKGTVGNDGKATGSQEGNE